VRATEADNGLTLTVYGGTTGTLLAWDADEGLRDGLLGFAVKRYGGKHPEGAWLAGGIGFPAQNHPPGEFLDTHLAPIQAFRWGDYTVYPDTEYRYELVPMYEPSDALRPGPSVTTAARTEKVDQPPHSIVFNRAVAASQAYSRRFGDDDPHDNAEARDWLGRGLDTFLEEFIARAGPDSALDIVIYEYELEAIRNALRAAAGRGATVRIVYHAQRGDEQTATNAANIAADMWPQVDVHARLTPSICHDKTIVLSRLVGGERQPQAVLTGSTNWTFNGLYYQGNVAHVIDDPALAQRYLALFEQLFGGATQAQMRAWLAENDPVPASAAAEPLELLCSPRPDRGDLDYYVGLVRAASRSLIFATAFDLDEAVLSALAGEAGAQRILRYGLQNSASRVTGYNRERASDFTATGRLRTAPDQFLRERVPGQRGNILIHSKIVLIDFDTASPTLISGSANYSHNSSQENDENTIVVRRDTRVADIYLTEVFRLFDHYRFRYNWAHPDAAGDEGQGTETRRVQLDDTPAWAGRYYDDPTHPRAIERQQLSRPLGG
jgi:phosphatidylserine/phosphatidylglycerophosphate/cardiolipin synthase-like enzyme